MPMILNRENAFQGSMFKSQSRKLLSKLPNVEDSEERLKLKQVGATECNGLEAVSQALQVDSKAQASETHPVSEDPDSEAHPALLPSDHERVTPPRGNGHQDPTLQKFHLAKADLLRPTSSKDTPSKGFGHPKSTTTKFNASMQTSTNAPTGLVTEAS